MKRVIALLLAVGAVLVAAPLPAHAATQYTGWRHRSPDICIEQNVDASMGLAGAAREWNATALNYVVKGDRWHPNACAAYPASQRVIVRYYNAYSGDKAGWCAYYTPARLSNGNWGYIDGPAELWIHLRHLRICTGNTLAGKQALVTHELGHDAGLGHVDEYSSIVCGGSCGKNYVPSRLDLWRANWRMTHPL
jgi:hypothetical protein